MAESGRTKTAQRNWEKSIRMVRHQRLFSQPGQQYVQAETVKEKAKRQASAKEGREVRRQRLEATHKYVMAIVADHLQIEVAVTEEFVIDSEKNVNILSEFFVNGGSRSLKFFYQKQTVPRQEECGKSYHGASKGAQVDRLFITKGDEEALTGICVYFLRQTNTKAISMQNIYEEICFGVLDPSSGGKLLRGFEVVMQEIYEPCLKTLTNWGYMTGNSMGTRNRKQFLENYDSFMTYLHNAQVHADQVVELITFKTEKIDVNNIKTVADCVDAAINPEVVPVVEELVLAWCKQIEQILVESEQIRKEADDTGPLAELEHWRQLMARFNSLLEQIRSHKCLMVVTVLNVAHSKVLLKWRDLDKSVTDHANEAKDNVKYLYTLEKYCEPLYTNNPMSMINCLPGLINVIRMIHNISQYYNTSERMTSLFIKVTNQMVKSCKLYITDDGAMRVWEQPPHEIYIKLEACGQLFHTYQDVFQRIKKKIDENPGEKPFEFSEMYIFGKFSAFCKRLEKIIFLLRKFEDFSMLGESTIEGIDVYANRFHQLYGTIMKKPYDILDQRKLEFDNDCEDFARQFIELEIGIQGFMDGSFQKLKSTTNSLKLLVRYHKLD